MSDAGNTTPDGKVPRDKYEETLAQLKAQTERNDKLSADLAFTNAKVTVSDRQRRIILRELGDDKAEVTAENVAEVAQELGFATAPANTPPATPPTDQQNQDNENNNGNGNGQGQNGPTPQQVMVSLDEMNVIDRANYHAKRGNVAPDLDTLMKNAKSPEELTSIIRSQGASSGLVHEWDVD